MLATIVMTILVFVLFMFKVGIFIVYFDYILSITNLLLCLCISSYALAPMYIGWVVEIM
jgi:hypothetical protein